jgi:hypothetical protein
MRWNWRRDLATRRLPARRARLLNFAGDAIPMNGTFASPGQELALDWLAIVERSAQRLKYKLS